MEPNNNYITPVRSLISNKNRSYYISILKTYNNMRISPISAALSLLISLCVIFPSNISAMTSITPVKSFLSFDGSMLANIRRNSTSNASNRTNLMRKNSLLIKSKLEAHRLGVLSFFHGVIHGLQHKVGSVYNGFRSKSLTNTTALSKRFPFSSISFLRISRFKSSAESFDSRTSFGSLEKDLALSMSYLSKKDDFWQYLGDEQGISVWKTYSSLCHDKHDKKWVCVMSKTTINVPPDKLKKLLLDSSMVKYLNKYSGGRDDIEVVDPNTKVVWTKSRIPYTIKPFDFCTLIRDYYDQKTNSIYIISKAVDHEKCPETNEYARSHIIFGLNVLSSIPDDPNSTHLISVNHVKYKGIFAGLAAQGAYQGSVNYLLQLKKVAPDLVKHL